MEKVVHILIGHYTKIIVSSETIVPIGTKPFKYQNRRKRQMDTPTHKYNYMITGLVQALQYKVTGLT